MAPPRIFVAHPGLLFCSIRPKSRDLGDFLTSPAPPGDLARSLLLVAGVLKIQLLDQQDGTATLELAGRVLGPWVDELSRSCERILKVGGTLRVDLGGVSFVDRAGVKFLQRLQAREVALVNCSPFVAEQLKGGL